jgi:hypothetical protein
MNKQELYEGLKTNDLEGLIENIVSINEFEPKTDSEDRVCVIAFSVKDKEPADDLAKYIDRSYYDVIDAEASPGPGKDGTFKVFVEVNKDEDIMKTLGQILYDVKNITGLSEWNVKFHGRDDVLSINEDQVKKLMR